MVALWLVLLAAGQSDAPPPLRRTDEGQLIVEAPDRELRTYRIQFDTSTRLTAAERLHRLIEWEPFEIVEEDIDAGTATVRLTATGAARLASPDSWQHLAATSIAPQPRAFAPRCVSLHVELRGQENGVGRSEPCPRSDVATQLVIEGLDSRGRRLWVVAADDPRNLRSVMGPNGEPHITARDEDQALSADIAVPTIRNLRMLRWYEVTEDNQLRRIGESRWRSSR